MICGFRLDYGIATAIIRGVKDDAMFARIKKSYLPEFTRIIFAGVKDGLNVYVSGNNNGCFDHITWPV